MEYYDFHTHCQFSDDSETLMEVQIEKAIELKLKGLCFTDHVDYGIKSDWNEETKYTKYFDPDLQQEIIFPTTNVVYPKYFAKFDEMKKLYGERIDLFAGLEFGIQTHTIHRYQQLLKQYDDKLDFILLSIHQVNNKEFWNQDYQMGKTQKEYNDEYYQELLDVIERFNHFDIVAHLDLIIRYDKQGVYPFENNKEIITRILKTIIQKGKGIELNTSCWRYHLNNTTPSKEILQLYYDLGGRIITLGSDAHKAEQLADHFEEAVSILKEIGFQQAYYYQKHQPIAYNL